jgi:AcrR family transcriptional regulator
LAGGARAHRHPDDDRGTLTDTALNRTERKRIARIALIERTAAQVFAEKGYEGANLEEIAAELDLRGSSLYHYFSSKEDLFLRCLRHSAGEVFSRLGDLAARHDDPTVALKALLREQVLIETRDFPEFVPLFFAMYVPVVDLRREVLRLRQAHAEIFEAAAARLAAELRPDPFDLRVWLGISFGSLAYLREWYDPSGPMTAEQIADRMAEALIRSFPLAATRV